MRVKFSFLKSRESEPVLPLHHQKLISIFVREMLEDEPNHTGLYNFSTLKGTSKVQAGQIRYMSSKVSLAFASADDKIVEHLIQRIFSFKEVHIGKMVVIPKAHQLIHDPEFKVQMKYVCISPLVIERGVAGEEPRNAPLDPSTHAFSDHLYNVTIERMEKAGYSEEDLNSFAEFELQPDKAYMQRINEQGKKLVRHYKNDDNEVMPGYLIPFTLHAHPKVQKFIWDTGLGLYCNNGFGMVDLATTA
ncbi:MAG TPA: CRISPR-associated endoribonuclease Cas6 [Bacteroidia bacterium]|nr:CRISPR-associated endoribonuclease Cas6 [Bacteroidia bacterium]